jgi:ABC-2 type transport system ATP-binding protein
VNPILEIKGLTKRYPHRHALATNDVSFSVEAGEIVGLLGHNGAGKTTLVRMIAAQLRPNSGSIRVAGKDIIAHPSEARRLCSVQAQSQVSINGLTPRRAIQLIGRLRGGSRREVEDRIGALADRLELTEWLDRRSRPGEQTLTGGVLRLVAFCMAAVAPGPVIVLDEPTNDVDPVRRRFLWAEIRRLADRGHAVVLVTHNVVEAERSIDRVLLLHHGRLIVDDSPSALLSDVDGRLRVDVSWEPGTTPELPGYLIDAVLRGRDLVASADPARLTELMAWGEAMRKARSVEHFSVGTATLDDVYVRAVHQDDRRGTGDQFRQDGESLGLITEKVGS